MSKDINLLPDITLKEEKQGKVQKLLTISSMAILIIGGVAVIGVYTVYLNTKGEYEKAVTQNETLIKNISTYAETEIIQRGIVAKEKAAAAILKTAKDHKTLVEDIQAQVPDGIIINDIQVDVANKISINAKSNNSDNFNQYVSNLLDPEKGGKKFTAVTIGSVSGAKDGSLQFTVNMSPVKPEAAKSTTGQSESTGGAN